MPSISDLPLRWQGRDDGDVEALNPQAPPPPPIARSTLCLVAPLLALWSTMVNAFSPILGRIRRREHSYHGYSGDTGYNRLHLDPRSASAAEMAAIHHDEDMDAIAADKNKPAKQPTPLGACPVDSLSIDSLPGRGGAGGASRDPTSAGMDLGVSRLMWGNVVLDPDSAGPRAARDNEEAIQALAQPPSSPEQHSFAWKVLVPWRKHLGSRQVSEYCTLDELPPLDLKEGDGVVAAMCVQDVVGPTAAILAVEDASESI
ncbi:hypothetical protein BC828DRAFT_407377 [Blastocladiella britannica]|nr:hypothetical protein BC828DRAFT_407377 [Blastocladiella britannica]